MAAAYQLGEELTLDSLECVADGRRHWNASILILQHADHSETCKIVQLISA